MKQSIIFVLGELLASLLLIISCEQATVLSVNQSSLSFDEYGGEQTIIVTANKEWVANSNKNWCKVSPTYAEGEGPLTVTCGRNTAYEQRIGEVTLQSEEEWIIISITQEAAEPYVEFRDNGFKEYCLKNFDKNRDGGISLSEAKDIYEINVSTENIRTLEGIEYMTNLRSLICRGPSLNSKGRLAILNIINNTELTHLNCENNQLATLDLSKNIKLGGLYCSGNSQLQGLDLRNNINLIKLHCSSCQLNSLDLSKNTSLQELSCDNNHLSSISLSNCRQLTHLFCIDNNISNLDVSNCTSLNKIYCYRNQLTNLDVSKNMELLELRCSENRLSSLNFGGYKPKLTTCSCDENNLTTLDVSGCPVIESLSCSENLLSSLDVSHNLKLSKLYCKSNPLLKTIWLKTGQTIRDFGFDESVATIKYK